MEIRPATEADIPIIVSLLKVSLGESLLPKSEQYWKWKHVNNPFGRSPVLLAFEGGTLIGVRAFMRWSWQQNTVRFSSLRAVDTATHPDYQGKGVFSKLTKGLVKECLGSGDAFIFNSPNKKSMPGYLKMGWKLAGRLPIRVQLKRPMSFLWNLTSRNSPDSRECDPVSIQKLLEHPGLSELLSADHSRKNYISTRHTLETLRWRYADVPLVKYAAIFTQSQGELNTAVIYRLKSFSIGTEMRITDVFCKTGTIEDLIKKQIAQAAALSAVHFVTGPASSRGLLTPASVCLPIGPLVTVRELNVPTDELIQFRNWSPSIGDIELF